MGKRGKPVTIGLVGCGRVALTRHLPALFKLSNARVLAAVDSDAQRLQDVSKRFRIPRLHESLDPLLKDDEIEAVAICVPARFHTELALAVLDAGKHLFIEKPLALSSSECLQMIQRSTSSKQVAMVGFNLRWHRLVRQARQILELGILGEVKLVNSISTSGSRNDPNVSQWRLKRETGGGVLIEQAIHHFDLWRFILQDEVAEVFATSLHDDETATVTARMHRGALVASTFSEGTAHDNELRFFGKNGGLRLSNYRFDGLEILPAHGHAGDLRSRLKRFTKLLKQAPQVIRQFSSGGDFVESYSAEWRHFLDCVEKNIPAQTSLEDGYRAVKVLEAILKSVSIHAPVSLEAPETVPVQS